MGCLRIIGAEGEGNVATRQENSKHSEASQRPDELSQMLTDKQQDKDMGNHDKNDSGMGRAHRRMEEDME